MKIFDLEQRMDLKNDDKELNAIMDKEYGFYKSICKDYKLNEIDYKVCDKVNMQLRTTLKCNAKCKFCIEQFNKKNKEIYSEDYVRELRYTLNDLEFHGITPTITITGGEPCIYKLKLIWILEEIKRSKVSKFNLNTNGILLDKEILDKIKDVKMPYLNISLHNYDLDKNKKIFRIKDGLTYEQLKFIKDSIGGTYYDNTRVRLQCVLMKGHIDSLEEIKKYLEFAKSLGFDNVAFRGLSKLKEENKNAEIEDDFVDMFSIMNYLKDDEKFKFNCQNISDHYLYEDWVYDGNIDVHFAYSDMDILEKRELKEMSQGINYAREFVLYEDGNFSGGWNKSFKKIR